MQAPVLRSHADCNVSIMLCLRADYNVSTGVQSVAVMGPGLSPALGLPTVRLYPSDLQGGVSSLHMASTRLDAPGLCSCLSHLVPLLRRSVCVCMQWRMLVVEAASPCMFWHRSPRRVHFSDAASAVRSATMHWLALGCLHAHHMLC